MVPYGPIMFYEVLEGIKVSPILKALRSCLITATHRAEVVIIFLEGLNIGATIWNL